MVEEKCSREEDLEFARLVIWLRVNGLIGKSFYTARRKPKEVKVAIFDKRTKMQVGGC